MKTVITLTDEQVARLDAIAQREHISRAEAIRRAVDRQYTDFSAAEEAQAAERALQAAPDDTFGLWADRKTDAVAYVNTLRDEWSR